LQIWLSQPVASLATGCLLFSRRSSRACIIRPVHASVAKFTSEAEGDRIVLHSPDLGAADSRWSFLDIRRDTFTFRDEATNDGGKTWRLRSEYHMTRRAPDAPAP
jgi:hypothetical protein